MAKIEKFTFYVSSFISSETMDAMNAEEIGQFLLLLVHAWHTGKDTSIPDSKSWLKTKTRSERLSDKVLAEFPVVETEWGPRRRNKRLYQEWMHNAEQSEIFSERASKAANAKHGNQVFAEKAYELREGVQKDASSMLEASSKQWQAASEFKTGQYIPSNHNNNQSIITESDVLTPSQIEKLPHPNNLPLAKVLNIFKKIWRNSTGQKFIPVGSKTEDFEKMLAKYGSAHVISAFELWVKERGDFTPKYAGHAFLKASDDALDSVKILNTSSENEIGEETYEQLEARMKTKLAADAVQDEIDRKKREADEKFELENRDLI